MQPDTTIADQNTERLIQTAYQPESASPAFIADVEKLALATAHALAQQPTTTTRAPSNRWRLTGLIVGGVAALLLIGFALWNLLGRQTPVDPRHRILVNNFHDGVPQPQATPIKWTDDVREGMMPRQRPVSPPLKSLRPGETLTTKAGERRLVQLADGSRLFINEKTSVEARADRQLALHKGQIYLEVAPKEDAPFVVHAGQREITATGTHFAVQVDPVAAAVVVTQGKVAIKDSLTPGPSPGGRGEIEVTAGQRVAPGESKISTAPRASHALEWTRELLAAAETPMVPACRFEGGALLALDPQGQEIKLALRAYNIDVHIEDGFARTTIDQTYFNTTWDRLEGTFYFPLPADASLSRLAMYVADANNQCKLMEGGMAERKHAADVYETIRYMRRDPALLEWLDGTTFKMRVFPLEAKQEKRIILSYTQKLPSLYGNTRYRFAGGHNMPLVRDWSFTARVKSGAGMNVWSPSHEKMQRIPQTGDVLMTLLERNIKPEQDVVVEMQEPAAVYDQDVARFSTFLHENEQYLMLRYRPKMPSLPERKRRDWIILFEASAGRDPLLAGTQLDVVRELLRNAEYDDTFTLLTVNTNVQIYGEPSRVSGRLSQVAVTDPLRGSARPARPANVAEAIQFLRKTHLVGALDLEQGLQSAVKIAKDAKNPHILHIGSGIPAIGERDAGKLAQSLPTSVTYVGVGVGKRWNRAFMKAAAERTNGVFTQINPDEVISWRAFELLATLNTPRLLDVRVADIAEKSPTRFLLETTMIAQGEEICAVARVDATKNAIPGHIRVTGTLDGQRFRRDFTVMNVLPGAGYLPRTWAKLQIDHLLSDNAAKHKSEIIALSKAMYVMSPFTSLLVLETDADYEKYKVDKGRKDHWAMYQCPPKIPLVYEPDGDKTSRERKRPGAPRKKDAKPTVEEVALTMAGFSVRDGGTVFLGATKRSKGAFDSLPAKAGDWAAGGLINPPLGSRFDMTAPGTAGKQATIFSTFLPSDPGLGVEINETPAYFPPLATWKALSNPRKEKYEVDDDRADAGGKRWQMELERARRLYEKGVYDLRTLQLVEGRAKDKNENVEWRRFWMNDQPANLTPYRIHGGVGPASESIDPEDSAALAASWIAKTRAKQREFDAGGEQGDNNWMLRGVPNGLGRFEPESVDDQKKKDVRYLTEYVGWRGYEASSNEGIGEVRIVGSKTLASGVTQQAIVAGNLVPAPFVNRAGDVPPVEFNGGLNQAPFARSADAAGQPSKQASYRYERPALPYDRTVFTNLAQYAPGLITTDADVLGTLEAEAEIELPKVGTIDPAARQLIDKARGAGWAALAVSAQGPLPGYKIAFNGLGQFAYERVLVSGLTEQVICDGKTLLYLYPEIGLASKRAMSRHHQHLIAAINPAFLPSAEELARGCDVRTISATTIAIVPRRDLRAGSVSDGATSGKTVANASGSLIHVVFAKDGTLSERQVVEMPAGKILWRQIHHADGSVEWKNAEEKTVAKIERSVAPAAPPNLTPKVGELVVIQLPLRTRDYLVVRAGMLGTGRENDADVAADCFVSDCLTGKLDANHRLSAFAKNVYLKGDRRLGFFTLINAAGVPIDEKLFASADGKETGLDLAKEHPDNALALFLAQAQRELKSNDQTPLKKMPGVKDGFIQRLSAFRDLWLAWQNQRPLLNGGREMPLEKAKVIDFLHDTTSPTFAYAILDTMQRRCNTPPIDLMLGIADKRFGPISSPLGLGYVFKYEHARAVWQMGNGAEAARLFRTLHADTLKFGVLPPIDPAFRDTLQMPLGDGPRFIAYTRKTLDELLGKKRYGLAFQLAKQMEQLGDEALCDEILTTILTKASAEERNGLTLACVDFLAERKNFVQADRLLVKVLADKKLAEHPGLWRLRSALAKEAGQPAVSIACLEKALDLEYADLPEVVNLESVRGDYRTLLTHYQKVAEASASLSPLTPNPSPPLGRGEQTANSAAGGRGEHMKAFLAKVIRVADRWRLIDPEHAEPSLLAGKILFTMGERELAWDYWTTPIDLHPAESRPWLDLATTMQGEGDFDRAGRALGIAFEAEPTNPEILWQRAQNAVRMGQPERARQLYRQIADSDWQERFQGTVEQARGLAGK